MFNPAPNLRSRPAAFVQSLLLFVGLLCTSLRGHAQIECSAIALRSAVAMGGSDQFDCAGTTVTITLTNSITVSTDVALDGTNQALTISGGNSTPLFIVTSNAHLTLKNLSLINGKVTGVSGT